MPEYIDHPVKDMRTRERDCKLRHNPSSPERLPALNQQIKEAAKTAVEGKFIVQNVIGGHMY